MGKTILAIDTARHFGWAFGPTDGTPICGHAMFSERGGLIEVCASAQRWLARQIKHHHPDVIVIEEPVYMNGANTMVTHDFLHGICTVLQTQALLSGCFNVKVKSLHSARAFFVPKPPLRKGEKRPKSDKNDDKRRVRQRCIELGWIDPETDDGNLDKTDALCMWAYGVSLVDANETLRMTPLFQGAN